MPDNQANPAAATGSTLLDALREAGAEIMRSGDLTPAPLRPDPGADRRPPVDLSALTGDALRRQLLAIHRATMHGFALSMRRSMTPDAVVRLRTAAMSAMRAQFRILRALERSGGATTGQGGKTRENANGTP